MPHNSIFRQGMDFNFFLNIDIFFIISLYKYCWKITVFCSFYLETEFLM